MRFVIYGVGAIGGTVAAALALAGREVAGIARGRQLEAIRDRGLLFRTPGRTDTVRLAVADDPAELGLRADDVVILAMKGQDTQAALERLRAAGLSAQPVVCAQNGVANERAALRLFPNVYGVTVMMPADYTVPGEVNCYGVPRHGIFEIGRYPRGRDGVAEAIAEALGAGGIAAYVEDEVMAGKHGKLLMNLANVMEAARGRGGTDKRWAAAARAEGEAVYRAAGIVVRDVGADPRRNALMRLEPIAGITRAGGSSTQSLMRGTGSIETDYLNGEIVLLGRLHGVPTPVNAFFQRLGARLVREGLEPGGVPASEIEAGLAEAGVRL
jgi:2-dehydropantoate 2-reductase